MKAAWHRTESAGGLSGKMRKIHRHEHEIASLPPIIQNHKIQEVRPAKKTESVICAVVDLGLGACRAIVIGCVCLCALPNSAGAAPADN